MTETVSIDKLRSYVEGYPEGGRIERHSHDWDQLSLISQPEPRVLASAKPVAGVGVPVDGRQSIGEIAEAVGYDSAAAFSTAFKQCFGVPPSNYLAG
jgi:AraC-like DNA-binding protein